MTQKTQSMAYDDPVYRTRIAYPFEPLVAGSTRTYEKFVAFTALKIFSIGFGVVTAGTSTYTLWNGTATVTTTGTGDSMTVYKLFTGGGTATFGPYALNAAAVGFNKVQLYGTGTASYAGEATADGGLDMEQGDQLYVVSGTDATAVMLPVLEYGIASGATLGK